jgi:DcmR-like sensory protein
MTAEQLYSLQLSHGLHRSFGYNILENPSINQHIALMYDNDNQRDAATTKYINEGLKRNQLCVYGSIHVRDKVHQEDTSSLIDNYEKNVREGNLFVVDLARHYIAAMTDDFTPFEEIKQRLNVAVANRADKHVRLVGDCVSFLFKNRHFDECIDLEQWWHHKPFEGSYLCTYPKHLIGKYPYDIHKFRILVNHDIIADSDENIVSAHISEKESRRH